MALTDRAIDVHPPRAKRWMKPARKLNRGRYAIGNRVSAMLDRLESIRIDRTGTAPPVTMGLVARLLVPGWAQFYLHRPGRGHVFLMGAGLALLLALVFVGTGYGSLALATLFSLHAASISDAIMAPGASVWASIGNGVLVYVVLGVLIYLPSIWMLTRIAVPYGIQHNIAPFMENDVLLVHSHGRWRRGQVVLYDRAGGQVQLAPLGHERRYLRLDGLAIDRILAGPGDHIQSDKTGLMVNGMRTMDRPLNAVSLPPFDLVIPPGRYLIWPSVVGAMTSDQVLTDSAITPEGNITGVVFFRTFPWSRAGFIR
jgi:hypothetical protein